jgi:hypothetical protein
LVGPPILATAPPPPSGGTGPANSSSDAIAIVKAELEKEKGACNLTYTTLVAEGTSFGWTVEVDVVTSGNPGKATFGVKQGTTEINPADPLSSEILAGCP